MRYSINFDSECSTYCTKFGIRLGQPVVHVVQHLYTSRLQGLVGTVGFLANSLAVPVLCSREMNSIFNRLLVFLSLWDNLYIVCSVLEGIRKHRPFSQVRQRSREREPEAGMCFFFASIDRPTSWPSVPSCTSCTTSSSAAPSTPRWPWRWSAIVPCGARSSTTTSAREPTPGPGWPDTLSQSASSLRYLTSQSCWR